MRWSFGIATALALALPFGAVADSVSGAQDRLDAMPDAQLVALAIDWLRAEGTDCVLPMSRDVDQRMQAEVEGTVFDMADVAQSDRPALHRGFNRRMENLLEEAVENGVLVLSPTELGIEVTISDC